MLEFLIDFFLGRQSDNYHRPQTQQELQELEMGKAKKRRLRREQEEREERERRAKNLYNLEQRNVMSTTAVKETKQPKVVLSEEERLKTNTENSVLPKMNLYHWFHLTPRGILHQFSKLPGAKLYLEAVKPEKERFSRKGLNSFCYIPGTRKDRVVLVAHVDTVWEHSRSKLEVFQYRNKIDNGLVYCSNSHTMGIGADDRAGVAILWELRELGHSLLLVDGEESGCVASSNLVQEFPKLAAELNSHQFMVQFDRRGSNDCVFYSVGSPEFYKYVQKETTFVKAHGSSTDITRLCLMGKNGCCGVNLSVGYYNEHTSNEILVLNEWQHTLNRAKEWLSRPDLPKFIYTYTAPNYSGPYYDFENSGFDEEMACRYPTLYSRKPSPSVSDNTPRVVPRTIHGHSDHSTTTTGRVVDWEAMENAKAQEWRNNAKRDLEQDDQTIPKPKEPIEDLVVRGATDCICNTCGSIMTNRAVTDNLGKCIQCNAHMNLYTVVK